MAGFGASRRPAFTVMATAASVALARAFARPSRMLSDALDSNRNGSPRARDRKAAMSVTQAMVYSNEDWLREAFDGGAVGAAGRPSYRLRRSGRRFATSGTFFDQGCPLLPSSKGVRSLAQFGLSGHRNPGRKAVTRCASDCGGADPHASSPGLTNARRH